MLVGFLVVYLGTQSWCRYYLFVRGVPDCFVRFETVRTTEQFCRYLSVRQADATPVFDLRRLLLSNQVEGTTCHVLLHF